MAVAGTIRVIASMGGTSVEGLVSRSATGGVPPQEITLAAGIAGTLTTRTNDTDGEMTVEAGHGIVQADIIDVFWTDANSVLQCAYGAVVGVLGGATDIPFTAANGTVLPAQDYATVCDEQEALDCTFDGDKLECLIAMHTRGGHILFEDVGNAALEAQVLPANEPLVWWDKSAFTSPILGNPVHEVRVSNADSSNTAVVKVAGVVNSDT